MQVNHKPFPNRFATYLKQRFPVIPLFLFSTFTAFALISLTGSIDYVSLTAVSVLYVLFLFHLRLIDEFKDAAYDAKNHPQRPVPQGLVTFSELKLLSTINLFGMVLLASLVFLPSLVFLLLTLSYTLIMFHEFWILDFWKKAPVLYLVSHEIVFIPLYLLFFSLAYRTFSLPDLPQALALAYLIIPVVLIEIGRKIPHRFDSQGKPTTDTYAYLWGQVYTIQVFGALVILAGIFTLFIPARLFITAPFLLVAGFSLIFAAPLWTQSIVRHSLALTTVTALLMPLLLLGPLS